MPKGVRAYKSKLVLRHVSDEVPEPYRSALLIHGALGASRITRAELLSAELGEVTVRNGVVYLRDAKMLPKAGNELVRYLRGFRATVESMYLFPLPRDPGRPANEAMAKRYLTKIINDTTKPEKT